MRPNTATSRSFAFAFASTTLSTSRVYCIGLYVCNNRDWPDQAFKGGVHIISAKSRPKKQKTKKFRSPSIRLCKFSN